jgi:predicted nucleic acid-binding protein
MRGTPKAVTLLDSLLRKNVACIHPVCSAEMLQGVRDKQHLFETLRFLGAFRRVSAKPVDHDRCMALMIDLRLSHKVDWPDCLIGATCLRLELPVVTLNDKDFRPIRGLQVIRPY